MSLSVFHQIQIIGMSGAAPKKVVDNQSFSGVIGEEKTKRIIESTGVVQFRKAEKRQTASDLAYAAAEDLLNRLAIEREEIGVLLFVSDSPDYIDPATAFVLHKRLKLSTECISIDANQACSGFVYGVHMACSLLRSTDKKYALLLNGTASKYPDMEGRKNPDHSNLMLFGDAAAATLLSKTDTDASIKTTVYSDGSGYKLLYALGACRCKGASAEVTTWSDGIDRSIYDPFMDGMGVFSFATQKAPESIRAFLEMDNKCLDDFRFIYLHQANKMIIERIAKLLKVPKERVPISIDRFGNTSGATIPVTIVDHLGENNANETMDILCCGFGAGLSWGVCSIEIKPSCVFPMIYTDDFYEEGEVYPF